MSKLLNWKVWLLFSVTLGLAPFKSPYEPHLVGKINWVLGGAKGMKFMDWIDLLLHGMPILMFIVSILYLIKNVNK